MSDAHPGETVSTTDHTKSAKSSAHADLANEAAARRRAQDAWGVRNWAGAESAWREVLETAPYDVDALGGLADALLKQRRPDEVEGVLANAISAFPGNRRIRTLWALTAQARHRFQDAARLWRALLDDDPNYVSAELQLGITYFSLKQYGQAREHLLKVRDVAPDRPDLRLPLARYLAYAGDREGAIAHFRRHIDATRDPVAALELAEVLIERGDADDAEALLRPEMLEGASLTARHWAVKTRAAARRGDWAGVHARLRAFAETGPAPIDLARTAWKVLDDLPGRSEGQLRRILLARVLNAVRGSASELLAMARREDRPDIELALGEIMAGEEPAAVTPEQQMRALLRMREYEAAVDRGVSLLEAPDCSPTLRSLVLEARTCAGDQAGVVAELTTQTSAERDAATWRVLGEAKMALGDLAGARLDLLTAIRIDPQDPFAPLSLSAIYAQQGRFLEAIAACRQALAIGGATASSAALALARLLRRVTRDQDAVAALQTCLDLEPLSLQVVRELQAFADGEVAWRPHVERLAVIATTPEELAFVGRAYAASEPAHALAYLDAALTDLPRDAGLLTARAEALLNLGRPTEAGAAAGSALRAAPWNFSAVDAALMAYNASGDFGAAATLLAEYVGYTSSEAFRTRHETLLVELALGARRLSAAFQVPHDTARARLWSGAIATLATAAEETQAVSDRLLFPEGSTAREIVLAKGYAKLDRSTALRIGARRELVDIFARSFPFATFEPVDRWLDDASAPGVDAASTFIGLPTLQLASIVDREAWKRVQSAGGGERLVEALDELFPDKSLLSPVAGYLVAHPRKRDAWRSRLSAVQGALKLGVALDPENEAALAGQLGVRPVRLCLPASAERDPGDGALSFPELNQASSFDDLAALIAELDVVVAEDPDVAELAAALGMETLSIRPPRASRWRFLSSGADAVHGSLRHLNSLTDVAEILAKRSAQ